MGWRQCAQVSHIYIGWVSWWESQTHFSWLTCFSDSQFKNNLTSIFYSVAGAVNNRRFTPVRRHYMLFLLKRDYLHNSGHNECVQRALKYRLPFQYIYTTLTLCPFFVLLLFRFISIFAAETKILRVLDSILSFTFLHGNGSFHSFIPHIQPIKIKFQYQTNSFYFWQKSWFPRG